MITFKEMTFKEKVDHIWEYYRVHIIIGLVILFVIGSLLNQWVFNPPKKAAVTVTLLGKYIDYEAMEQFQQQLTETFVEDPTNKTEAKVDFLMMNNEDQANYEMNMATSQKFMAMAAGKELDIVIGDKLDIAGFGQQNSFIKLEEVLSEDELKKIEDTKVVFKGEEDTEEHIYAINVSKNKILKDIKYDVKGKTMAIMINSQHKELGIKVLKWLIENNE